MYDSRKNAQNNPVMKILLIIPATLLLVILLWPQRLVFCLDSGWLWVQWLPLPRLACGVRVFGRRLALADVLAFNPVQTTSRQSCLKQKLAFAAASATKVCSLRVQVALGGGQPAAAVLAGALLAALHAGLARASCLVAAFLPSPADCVAVSLLPAGASLAQSRITARAELRLCLWRVGLAVLCCVFGTKPGRR